MITATTSEEMTKRRQLPDVWQVVSAFLVAALAYGALALVNTCLSPVADGSAVVWLVDALAVAILLRFRLAGETAAQCGMVAGAMGAALVAGEAIGPAGVVALGHITQIVVAITLTRRLCGPSPRMDDIAQLGAFALAAGVCAPLAKELVTAFLSLVSDKPPVSLLFLAEGAFSSGLDMLIAAPCAIVMIDALRNRRRPTRQELHEWLLLTGVGTLLTLTVFSQTRFPLMFLMLPIVVAHAFRMGVLGATVSTMKIAIVATLMTWQGYGPFNIVPYPHYTQLLLLECFLAASVSMGLPIAALLAARDRMMEQLEAQRQQLSLLADNITDSVLRYNPGGVCTYASPSTRRVLGYAPADFVGTIPVDGIHPQARDTILAVEQRMRSGQSEHERFTYRRYLDDANGQPVYIEADCALARHPNTGLPDGIIVSARDVSRRVELENQLKRARDHAEAAVRAKAQFLANMSHEIRTPMNGVLGFAEMLQRMDLPAEAARYAGMIDRSGRSMMALLNDILDISKIESGEMLIQREPCDVPRLVEDCVQLNMASAEQQGIALSVRLSEELPRWIVTDQLRLRQILLNLIGNAVKFTEKGSVTVSVTRKGSRLAIAVEDTGIGISADRLESVFDPFVQAEASTTRRFGGTGLGLSISRQLAGLLGGNLLVDSKPGAGSRFSLKIPLEVAREDARPQRRACDLAETLASQPGRVLLAEDHDINRMLVTAMLEELGQEVSLAHDGIEAIDAVIRAEQEQRPFDLVLMDIQMPNCDGYSATRSIRDLGVDPRRLPIIALTANAYAEDIASALEAGMQTHLAKPLSFEALAAVLARWMPVRITIEQGPQVLLPGRPPASQPAELTRVWAKRRKEALEAVAQAMREGGLENAGIKGLAQMMHKLAGSAGMFGEDELGRRAAALEAALKEEAAPDDCRLLAEMLLEAA